MLKVAIDRTIGLIGTPVLWLYRSTVRASIKRMIRLSPVEDFENANATADSLEAGMSAIAQSRSEIVSKTSQWSKSLSVVSSRVRNLALIPLGALAIVALLVAFLPVLILVWAS